MNKQVIKTDRAPLPIASYSQAIKVGNLVFVSGQVSIAPKTQKKLLGDIRIQTKQTLENLKSILNAMGLTLENVVKVTVFLKDMNDYGEMNKIYGIYFKTDPPARTTVEARLPGDVSVEIDAIAYSP